MRLCLQDNANAPCIKTTELYTYHGYTYVNIHFLYICKNTKEEKIQNRKT